MFVPFFNSRMFTETESLTRCVLFDVVTSALGFCLCYETRTMTDCCFFITWPFTERNAQCTHPPYNWTYS